MKHSLLTVLLVPALAAQEPVAKPEANAPAPAIVQHVRVAPGALCGRVLASGSRRPVPGHRMAVLDASGKQVADVATTAEGTYTTPVLGKGSYTLRVRDDLRLSLTVRDDAPVQNLDIVLPQGPRPVAQDPSRVPAAPGGAAPLPPVAAPGLGFGTWALIGAGTATAVAVPIAASGGSSSENPVSASGLGVRR